MEIIVEGCPVADIKPACWRCGGGWPGTKISTDVLTRAVNKRIVNPKRLGCQVLQDRVEQALGKILKVD